MNISNGPLGPTRQLLSGRTERSVDDHSCRSYLSTGRREGHEAESQCSSFTPPDKLKRGVLLGLQKDLDLALLYRRLQGGMVVLGLIGVSNRKTTHGFIELVA